MKYFIDTEFIEGFKKPFLGKKRHFIDLISIGVYCEDGRELYLISSEYDFDDADKWVQDNVIIPMYTQRIHGDRRNVVTARNFHVLHGMKNKSIAKLILDFFGCWRDQHFWRAPEGIEVYGYYSDYDWVLFCSLFGRMINLPNGFPMYCKDLKQMVDDCYTYQEKKYSDESRLDSWLKYVSNHPEYPKNSQEHNALADAKWNKGLYDFITQKKFLYGTSSGLAKVNS